MPHFQCGYVSSILIRRSIVWVYNNKVTNSNLFRHMDFIWKEDGYLTLKASYEKYY